ncbi:phosphonoacetaldehyde hydrolase [Pseudobacillus wudalianchiensis]|uniref:Phosphonoacetaldehyde hydrolase n=1 Tax=Pseudobacillus wudalianchiensis TaxID=1743143 RepID=A0A1B9B853_9BACI|nr:phosphonoacetaldehyde hydrolase [Bacillus wudalianchiensis]OCA92259.1 phosphonoacetaldehyde hydrolase [Bacillus wudalianchiensis]
MEKKIKGIIFDWAGTTVDYGCLAPVQVFVQIFKEKGIDITIEEARKPMGLLKIDHVRALTEMPRIKEQWNTVHGCNPEEKDIQEMYDRFEEELFAILPNYATPVPGCIELTEKLRYRGIKIGSTTGYTAEMMKIVAAEAKKQGYSPDYLVTSDEVPAGRPYPWMCYANAMGLGIYPMSSMIKVGDTVSDIYEGKNAGMWTVGVILGGSELGLSEEEVKTLEVDELDRRFQEVKKRFMEAGADFTILELDELETVIDKIEFEQRMTVS